MCHIVNEHVYFFLDAYWVQMNRTFARLCIWSLIAQRWYFLYFAATSYAKDGIWDRKELLDSKTDAVLECISVAIRSPVCEWSPIPTQASSNFCQFRPNITYPTMKVFAFASIYRFANLGNTFFTPSHRFDIGVAQKKNDDLVYRNREVNWTLDTGVDTPFIFTLPDQGMGVACD